MTGVSEGGAPDEAVGIAPAQSYVLKYNTHKRPIRKRMPFQLLLASAVSQRHLGRVMQAVKETCETHAWVRALLNVFDASQSMPLPLLPPCATIATVPGFKLLWWTRLLGPSATAGFTHVWIVDSDMDFRPSQFALETFVRVQVATNTSLLGPSPFGPGAGLYNLDGRRCRGSRRCDYCGTAPDVTCPVCREAWTEVKAPLFTHAAWAVVHSELLSRMPEDVLAAGVGHIDAIWCGLLDRALYNCALPWMSSSIDKKARVSPSCRGLACACSFATPLRHLDTHEINGAFEDLNNATRGNETANREALQQKKRYNRLGLGWMQETRPALPGMYAGARFIDWKMYPSWRPNGTLLSTKPCWHQNELKYALPAPMKSSKASKRATSGGGEEREKVPASSLPARRPAGRATSLPPRRPATSLPPRRPAGRGSGRATSLPPRRPAGRATSLPPRRPTGRATSLPPRRLPVAPPA